VNARDSRRAEDRADSFAVDLLASAGLDPSSFAAALGRIRDAAPRNSPLLQYFDPHSPVDQRILQAAERAKRASARDRKAAVEVRALGVEDRKLAVDWAAVVAALANHRGY